MSQLSSLRPKALSIHRQLLQLKSGKRVPHIGICNNLYINSSYGARRLREAIKSWPLNRDKNTGSYPVEGNPIKYCEAADAGIMWKNPRRLKLLNYLIEYYKPQIKS